jgi:hypothetical protein
MESNSIPVNLDFVVDKDKNISGTLLTYGRVSRKSCRYASRQLMFHPHQVLIRGCKNVLARNKPLATIERAISTQIVG